MKTTPISIMARDQANLEKVLAEARALGIVNPERFDWHPAIINGLTHITEAEVIGIPKDCLFIRGRYTVSYLGGGSRAESGWGVLSPKGTVVTYPTGAKRFIKIAMGRELGGRPPIADFTSYPRAKWLKGLKAR